MVAFEVEVENANAITGKKFLMKKNGLSPENIFNSLSEGNMLQIIVFALILGVILANMGDRVDIVKNFFGQFNDIMMEMTMAVMKLAPIGVFCLIAKTFAEIGFEVFLPLLKYMFCVLLALAVQCFCHAHGLCCLTHGGSHLDL